MRAKAFAILIIFAIISSVNLAARTLEEYLIIAQRNIFKPLTVSGAPAEPAEEEKNVEAEKTMQEFKGYILTGTVGKGGEKIAIIQNKVNKEEKFYKVGDEIEGAKILQINLGKSIILKTQEQTIELSIYMPSSTPKPVKPVSPASRRR